MPEQLAEVVRHALCGVGGANEDFLEGGVEAKSAVDVALERTTQALGLELTFGAHVHGGGRVVFELDEGVLRWEGLGDGVDHDGSVRGAVAIGGVASHADPIGVCVQEQPDSVESAFDAT